MKIEEQQLKAFLLDSELVKKEDIKKAETEAKETGSNLEVAMLDPEDLVTIEFIKKTADFKILPRLTNVASMKYVLSQYQKSLAAEFGEIIKVDSETLATVLKEPSDEVDVEDLKKTAEDLPIVRIVDTLIRHAILQRSSDIHIEPTEKEVLVRY